jgi:uncharacterized protein YjiS (DUF1127 family)
MIRIFHSVPHSMDELVGETNACPTAMAKMLRDLRDALREGLAAHREYERLTSSGMRHDPALRASLSVPFAERDHSHESSSRARPKVSSFSSALLTGVIGAWIERRRQRTALARLDDRLLRDIGLTRSQDGVKPLSFAGRA